MVRHFLILLHLIGNKNWLSLSSSTLSMDPKGPSGAANSGLRRGPIKFGLPNKHLHQQNSGASFRSRSPARLGGSRRRRRTSSSSSSSSGSRHSSSTSHSMSSRRRPRSPDYGENPNRIPLGAKGKSSPGKKFGSLRLGLGAKSQALGAKAQALGAKVQAPKPAKPGQQKRKLQLRTKKGAKSEDVDNDNDDDDDDVPYFYTNGSKRMTLDADLASTEKRQKRAARFAAPGQPTAGPRKKTLNLMASINMTLTSGERRSFKNFKMVHPE